MTNLSELMEIPDGWKLRRRGLNARTVDRLRAALGSPPATIIDVGAHHGQFLALAAAAFPAARIFSFEPVDESYAELERTAAGYGERVTTHRVALGEIDGRVEFFVNEFPASSSTLPLSSRHSEEFPENAATTKRFVEVQRLDTWAKSYQLLEPILIKLDVQGAELDVLEGAPKLLERVSSLLVEISLVELYQGAPLAADVIGSLASKGFRVSEIFDELRSPRDRSLLQMDLIFSTTGDVES